MKKRIFIFPLVASFILVGCGKNNGASVNNGTINDTSENTSQEVVIKDKEAMDLFLQKNEKYEASIEAYAKTGLLSVSRDIKAQEVIKLGTSSSTANIDGALKLNLDFSEENNKSDIYMVAKVSGDEKNMEKGAYIDFQEEMLYALDNDRKVKTSISEYFEEVTPILDLIKEGVKEGNGSLTDKAMMAISEIISMFIASRDKVTPIYPVYENVSEPSILPMQEMIINLISSEINAYLSNEKTMDEIIGDLVEIAYAFIGNELTVPEKDVVVKFVKDMIDSVTNVDIKSFINVTYSKDVFSFKFSYKNAMNEIKKCISLMSAKAAITLVNDKESLSLVNEGLSMITSLINTYFPSEFELNVDYTFIGNDALKSVYTFKVAGALPKASINTSTPSNYEFSGNISFEDKISGTRVPTLSSEEKAKYTSIIYE